MKNIQLHIEQLVLDGFTLSPHERTLLGSALETELTRLLAEGGIGPQLSGGISVPSITADSLQVPRGGTPVEMGQAIAHSVYGGLRK